MPFKKTEEEKAQKQSDKEAAAYARSPVGLAEAVLERGDTFLEIKIELDSDVADWVGALAGVVSRVLPERVSAAPKAPGNTDVLGDIEKVGWHLEHVGHMYVPTDSNTSIKDTVRPPPTAARRSACTSSDRSRRSCHISGSSTMIPVEYETILDRHYR